MYNNTIKKFLILEYNANVRVFFPFVLFSSTGSTVPARSIPVIQYHRHDNSRQFIREISRQSTRVRGPYRIGFPVGKIIPTTRVHTREDTWSARSGALKGAY